jgi:hypothetical protein
MVHLSNSHLEFDLDRILGTYGSFHSRKGGAVKLVQRYLILGLASASVPIALAGAPPVSADCTNAGYATVCAQGTVRGGGPTPPSGPAYPGYCADPWYCSDDWGIDIDLGPGRPGRPGGGGGGGGGGGIGPR